MHPKEKVKLIFRENNIGAQKKTLDVFINDQLKHVKNGCLCCRGVNNNLITSSGKTIQGGETSQAENIHKLYNSETHGRTFGVSTATAIVTKVNFDAAVSARKFKHGEELGESNDPLKAGLANSIAVHLGMTPPYPRFLAPLVEPTGEYGFDSNGGNSYREIYYQLFEKMKTEMEKERCQMKKMVAKNLESNEGKVDYVESIDWEVKDKEVNDEIKNVLERQGVEFSDAELEGKVSKRAFVERFLQRSLVDADASKLLPFEYDVDAVNKPGTKQHDEAAFFVDILRVMQMSLREDGKKPRKFNVEEVHQAWMTGVIVENQKMNRGEDHLILCGKTMPQLQDHYQKMYEPETNGAVAFLANDENLQSLRKNFNAKIKNTSQPRAEEATRLEPSQYDPGE